LHLKRQAYHLLEVAAAVLLRYLNLVVVKHLAVKKQPVGKHLVAEPLELEHLVHRPRQQAHLKMRKV
jgi:hypothetical protein